jgi:carbon monoxide dehydrogenase subunit G
VKLEGNYMFRADRQAVWNALLDPASLQRCIPGCEELVPDGHDKWRATLRVGVAAVKGTYRGSVAVRERSEPSSYDLVVEGSGAPGFVRGTARIVLEEDGGSTRVIVRGDGQVGGTVAGVGQRIVGGVAKMLMDQFFGCIRSRVESAAAR